MKYLKHFINFLLFLFFTSCTPVQGYFGEEKPKEKLATVYIDSSDDNIHVIRSTSSGFQFGFSGIRLKPGENNFDVSVNLSGMPYNCLIRSEFNQSRYRSCLRRRERAIRRERRNIPICNRREFVDRYSICDQDFTQFVCYLSSELNRNVAYNLKPERVDDNRVRLSLLYRSTNTIIESEECIMTTTERRRIRNRYL